MSVLVDSNILLRLLDAGDPQHPLAVEAVVRLRREGEALWVTAQNIAEFWAVATRPKGLANGLGLPLAAASEALSILERLFRLVPEDAAIYPLWRALVLDHRVTGNRVFDTRLVAAMRVHGIARVLTFNIRDFAGYDDVEVLDPAAPG